MLLNSYPNIYCTFVHLSRVGAAAEESSGNAAVGHVPLQYLIDDVIQFLQFGR